MTSPGPGSIGEAFIDVHANTKPFHRELPEQLNEAADRAEAELDKTGQKIGSDMSNGIDKEFKRRGPGFAKSISDGTKNTMIRVRSVIRFDRLRDTIRRQFRRTVGQSIGEEIADALDRSARSGIFNKISVTIADAIGAGFNVSGRSPLIAVLIPAILALVGVIVAALQAVNALVAVLFIIPSLIGAIALQVGVLVIAFQGIGEATQKAFAAKNPKELREALKDLTPAAQDFVKELLPLRDFFKQLRDSVQQSFFSQLVGSITALRKALGPTLISGFTNLAREAGKFLGRFAEVLASPQFKTFITGLFAATSRWVETFSRSLFSKRGFVQGLIAMGNTLMPFLRDFGDVILRVLDRLSGLMFQFASNPATQQWLDDMAETLQLVFDLLFKVGEFLFVFLKRLNEAGGAGVIEALSEALDRLMFVLASPVGQKAMEGLVNLAIFGIQSFTGLVIAILAVIAVAEAFSEWVRVTGGPFILDILRAIGQAAVDVATFLGVWIERIIGWIVGFFKWLWNHITTTKSQFSSLASAVAGKLGEVVNRIKGLPSAILNAAKNFGSLLLNAGRALVDGLINGIKQKVSQLKSWISYLASLIAAFLPGSPAEVGPLSGQGYTKIRGQHLVQDLISGIREEVPALREATTNAMSNIVFGQNSVQVNFQGALPTDTQARSVGTAVGNGAASMIAARNTRLAVRTL